MYGRREGDYFQNHPVITDILHDYLNTSFVFHALPLYLLLFFGIQFVQETPPKDMCFHLRKDKRKPVVEDENDKTKKRKNKVVEINQEWFAPDERKAWVACMPYLIHVHKYLLKIVLLF